MDIFGQLGINTTAGIQFVFFAIALLFLTKFVFTPYAHALEERQNKTKGGEDLAAEYQAKSVELQSEYESKIRALNLEIKNIVDASKSEANKQYETAVAKSRSEAEQLVSSNRTKIVAAVETASKELKSQTQAVALAITSKLLGK
ncbi:ATP synthase F0 subunit B [Bdellovibrio sp. SKB1291214]|uniref:ATP synthase F0 subunit B n=1 Tax=Bdellovibrio sp. SKB1291214 TaxID=1732569 RepID=UPI000B51C6B9|nr:ATP synthase F0 subunit B [Bdellovibrio sp. SKB1291214]UYL10562.1 ATP synthase F0 subunit B [Bdellovibrio sp. SKB1291214]